MQALSPATEPYQIIRLLGRGATGAVHLAARVGSDRRRGGRLVAIKSVHDARNAESESAIRTLCTEARLAAALSHPNIVQVHDLTYVGKSLGIVMDFVEGGDAEAALRVATARDEQLPLACVLRIATDLLDGLHAAHEQRALDGTPLGIIHRDVSPRNVLLGIDGMTRIADFGIARSNLRTDHTAEGLVKGSIGYFAPEQLHAGPIDRRIDVYAAGVLTWELCTGRRLHHGSSIRELYQRMEVPLPSARLFREIPPSLDHAIERSLARNRDDRFASAAAFRDALGHAALDVGGLASRSEVGALVERLLALRLDRLRTHVREWYQRWVHAERPAA